MKRRVHLWAVLACVLLSSAAAVGGSSSRGLQQAQPATSNTDAAAGAANAAVQAAIAAGAAALQTMNAQPATPGVTAAGAAANQVQQPTTTATTTTTTAATLAGSQAAAAAAVLGAQNTAIQASVPAAADNAAAQPTSTTTTAADAGKAATSTTDAATAASATDVKTVTQASTAASTIAAAAATTDAATTVASTTATTANAVAQATDAASSAAANTAAIPTTAATTTAATTTADAATSAAATTAAIPTNPATVDAATTVAAATPTATTTNAAGAQPAAATNVAAVTGSVTTTTTSAAGAQPAVATTIAAATTTGATISSDAAGAQPAAATTVVQSAVTQASDAQASQVQPQVAQAQTQTAQALTQVAQAEPQVTQPQTQATEAQTQITQAQPQVTQSQPQVAEAQPQANQAQPQVTQAQPEGGQEAQTKAQAQDANQDIKQEGSDQPKQQQDQQQDQERKEQQDDGQEQKTKKAKKPKKAPVVSQTVAFAPATTVANDDDVDDDGECEKEAERLCKGVEQGEGKLADCLSGAIAESESGEEDAPTVSAECREEVFQFKISRNANINANVPLAKACKDDAEMFCNVTWFFGYHAGQVLGCLKEVKAQISKPCKAEVYKVMMDAAVDFRSDPVLYEACKDDSESLCLGIDHGGGRIQACLRDKRMQLSWACEEQLFKQEMENADDIRLSVRLFAKCLPDKKKFCKDIEPGHARTKECLEEHREKLSGSCKDEIDSMIERRVHDFRLDPKLRDACEEDIFNMCAYYNNLEDVDVYDSTVINCLQDFSSEIKNDLCKEQVKKYVSLAAQDIRFDVPLAEACYDDRQKYCAHVPPGSARVMRCLSNKRDTLSPVCRATLFDEEVRFSENIDFQAPMKSACEAEIDRFCKRVPHENGRVIRCLQDNKSEKGFGKPCKEEVQRYEAEIGRDYRLNYRLRTACQKDIQSLCPSMCSETPSQACGGKVLRCLSDKSEEIKNEACQKEVAYFEKMEVSDFRNDIILAEACRDDVEKFCAKVEPGEGRVHKCLRDNVIKISKPCRKEELLLEEKEAGSIDLSPNLLRACKAERMLFCKGVAAGSARVFRCLAENVQQEDFGRACRSQIGYKLQRRQSNWRLDPPLRKACKSDVAKLCAVEDLEATQDGAVYKCMIRQFADLGSGCQREVSRAVHMAFFAYQPGAVLTSDCDTDVKRMCLKPKPNMAQQPGVVGMCLANILENEAPDRLLAASGGARRLLVDAASSAAAASSSSSSGPVTSKGSKAQTVGLPTADKLSAKCFLLADIAEPPNAKRSFESSLSYAGLLEVLDDVGLQTGVGLIVRDRRGDASAISLTGWAAMAGVAALVLLVVGGVAVVCRRLRGGHAGYTLVLKAEPK